MSASGDVKLSLLMALCYFDEFVSVRIAAALCINTLLNVSDLRNFPVPLEQVPNSIGGGARGFGTFAG